MSDGMSLKRDEKICPNCTYGTISDTCQRCGQDMNAKEGDVDKILYELMANNWGIIFGKKNN